MHLNHVRRWRNRALVLSGVLVAASAHADLTWTWRYSGHGAVACGTLNTSDNPDAAGFYRILRIDGRRGDTPISGLFPAGQAIPGNGAYAVDNLIRASKDGQITIHGIGFSLASGGHANPYFDPESGYSEVYTTSTSFSELPVQFRASPLRPGQADIPVQGRCE